MCLWESKSAEFLCTTEIVISLKQTVNNYNSFNASLIITTKIKPITDTQYTKEKESNMLELKKKNHKTTNKDSKKRRGKQENYKTDIKQ